MMIFRFSVISRARPVFGLFATIICACTIFKAEQRAEADFPGMRALHAAGKSFFQGSADSSAPDDEYPGMPVSFTYDFYLDTIEVTRELYASLVPAAISDSSDGLLPQCKISWYDAAVFCNARSKREHLDTVYTYAEIRRGPTGSIYDLVGLLVRYDRDGYRLPTESEWEYCAAGGAPNPGSIDSAALMEQAWCVYNSGGLLHSVAGRCANALGLYDMLGNALEWTGDWKAPYNGRTISNVVGGRYPNSYFERAVKGGSVMHGLSALRPACRSTTYPVNSSSSFDYLGFRCARGAIPSFHYLEEGGSVVSTNPVTLLAGNPTPILGTSQAKLVFVNYSRGMRTLCLVDFGQAHPFVYEFRDVTNVFSPTISPDGSSVAWSSQPEGARAPSSIYVRSLVQRDSPAQPMVADSGCVPRWWVDPHGRDTFIVYATSTMDNSDPGWDTTATYRRPWDRTVSHGAPDERITVGGFHDGLSKDNRYIVTGYTRLRMKDLQSGEQRVLFQPPASGKPAGGSVQVCNASISPEVCNPGQCLFLDFGSSLPSTVTGCAYSIHEYLFKGDFSDKILRWYHCPKGEMSWDFPEWSNVGRFAVAAARGGDDVSHALYAVDLRDSAYTKLVEGTSLWSPYLWIAPDQVDYSAIISADSLGQYDQPPLLWNQPFFKSRMLSFWQKRDSMEIVFVGTSHAAHGIDPSAMPHVRAFNMAFPAGDLASSMAITRNYLLRQCPRLKLVAVDLIPGLLGYKDGSTTWNTHLSQSKGFVYDKNHGFWASNPPAGVFDMMAKVPWPRLAGLDTLGLDHLPSAGWGGENPDISGMLDWCVDNAEYQDNMNRIYALASDLARRHIHLLLLITPESPHYRQTESYGRSGPNRPCAENIINQVNMLCGANPYVHLYDANNFGDHDYTDAEAYDYDHLCDAGAKKLSARVDSVLVEILAR